MSIYLIPNPLIFFGTLMFLFLIKFLIQSQAFFSKQDGMNKLGDLWGDRSWGALGGRVMLRQMDLTLILSFITDQLCDFGQFLF